jgi:hypothetical protein
MEEKLQNTKKNKILFSIIIALFLLSWVGYQYPNLIHDFRAKKFVDRWASIFSKCRSIECIYTSSGENPDFFYKKTFENGEWLIAVNADSCKGGAGYNASVFYGSDGIIYYQIGYKYCGQADFQNKLNEINTGDLTSFYDKLPFKLMPKMK